MFFLVICNKISCNQFRIIKYSNIEGDILDLPAPHLNEKTNTIPGLPLTDTLNSTLY